MPMTCQECTNSCKTIFVDDGFCLYFNPDKDKVASETKDTEEGRGFSDDHENEYFGDGEYHN